MNQKFWSVIVCLILFSPFLLNAQENRAKKRKARIAGEQQKKADQDKQKKEAAEKAAAEKQVADKETKEKEVQEKEKKDAAVKSDQQVKTEAELAATPEKEIPIFVQEVPTDEKAPEDEAADEPTQEEPIEEKPVEEKPTDAPQTETEEETTFVQEVPTDEKVPEKEAVPEEQKPTEEQPATVQEITEEPKEAPPTEEEQKKEEEAKVKIDEIEGIDTVDLDEPQGNWLFKRIWWQRAEEKYEKIKALVNSIFEMRMNFFTKRADLDKTIIDPFYIKNGLNRGELKERISQLQDELDKKRARLTVGADARSDVILGELDDQQSALEQMQKDVEGITQLDEALDSALSKLMEQINRVRSYEQDAWKNFKEISRVLDDKQARSMYFKMEVDLQNIKEIQNYLSSAFNTSFNQLTSSINAQINRVQGIMDVLNAKGLNFKAQVQQLQEKSEEPEDEDEEPAPGFFTTYIINPIASLFSGVWSGIQAVWNFTISILMWPFQKIFGWGEEPEEPEVEEEFVSEEVSVEVPQVTNQ